jgi:hypothetical protein
MNPVGVAAVGSGDQVGPAVAIKIPELGSEFGGASSTGNATARNHMVEPKGLGIHGRSVGALVEINEQASLTPRLAKTTLPQPLNTDEQIDLAIAVEIAEARKEHADCGPVQDAFVEFQWLRRSAPTGNIARLPRWHISCQDRKYDRSKQRSQEWPHERLAEGF